DLLCRAPPALACDKFKSCPHLSATGRTRRGGADNERLNDAVLPNRIDQFLQRFASKILPRLQRAWDNPCQADLVHSLARLGHFRTRYGGRRANQRTKTFTQTRTCHASEATGTPLSRQTAICSTARELNVGQSATGYGFAVANLPNLARAGWQP